LIISRELYTAGVIFTFNLTHVKDYILVKVCSKEE